MKIMLLPTFFLLHGVVNADGEERFDARAERFVHVVVRTGVPRWQWDESRVSHGEERGGVSWMMLTIM